MPRYRSFVLMTYLTWSTTRNADISKRSTRRSVTAVGLSSRAQVSEAGSTSQGMVPIILETKFLRTQPTGSAWHQLFLNRPGYCRLPALHEQRLNLGCFQFFSGIHLERIRRPIPYRRTGMFQLL